MNEQHVSQPKPHWLSRFLPTPGNVIFTLLVVTLAFWAQSVGALPGASTIAAPQEASSETIPYQGRLTDPNGSPLTGTYEMGFRLYDAATGGTLLWEEQSSGGVQVEGGLFNVMLGSHTPIAPSLFTEHDSLFLGVVVGGEQMSERVPLGSVPFAMFSSESKRYLFHAYSSNTVSISSDMVVPFAEVLDPDAAYSNNTFTAPEAGYYSFSTSISFDGGDGADDTLEFQFLHNSTPKNRIYINPRYWTRSGLEASESNSVILYLEQGDTVAVNLGDVTFADKARLVRGSFSGFYLGK